MAAAADTNLHTRCCIVGGGPAGVMLGLLLARAGVAVTVLEKHADFLRDFRGDTVHPSTLQILDELGLLREIRATAAAPRRPPRRDRRRPRAAAGRPSRPASVCLPGAGAAVGFPRPAGRRGPAACRIRSAHAPRGHRLAGARRARHRRAGAGTPDGAAHDPCRPGRRLRRPAFDRARRGRPARATTTARRWTCCGSACRARRRDPRDTFGIIDARPDDGAAEPHRVLASRLPGAEGRRCRACARSRSAHWSAVAQLAPFLADRAGVLTSWDDVSTLQVQVDRLPRWHRPGLLLIGDAAHAMSPIGGVGINLAIQDAVAAANALAQPLLAGGAIDEALLAQVQRAPRMADQRRAGSAAGGAAARDLARAGARRSPAARARRAARVAALSRGPAPSGAPVRLRSASGTRALLRWRATPMAAA